MRNLPSMDTQDEKVRQSAAAADSSTGVSGKYIATIERASLEETANGSVFVALHFRMPNGKIYKQDNKQIMKADGTEGYYVPKLRSLFGVTGAKDTLGSQNVMEFDFDVNPPAEREVSVPAYVDLIGKKVGVVLYYYQKYPESLGINGYTGTAIPNRNEPGYEEAKSLATTIWMPNYSKSTQPVFEFVQFFHPESEKSFSEMLDDTITEPVSVNEILAKTLKKPNNAIILDDKEWDKLRIKKLQYNLKRNGMQYNASEFIPQTSDNYSAISGSAADLV